MSVHSEIQNIKWNRSGDVPLNIHNRSGDSEDGDSYFDIRAGREQTPEEAFLDKGQARERALFLKRYFTVLSSALSPAEVRFLKLKIKTRKSDMLIARWCGISFRKLYQTIREKLSERQEEIEDLIDGSTWDNAELFAKTFLRSLKELSEDSEALESTPDDPHGDFDELERARQYCAVRERIMTIQEERHRIYSRGFEAGRYSERKRSGNDNEIYRAIRILAVIQGMLDSGLPAELINQYIETMFRFYEQPTAGA